jgi:suppressor for copper-sensitivity B
VFGALGLGMAAPFLAVATAPGLVSFLPRPGPWMGWLQRLLGLALLGTAVWLLFVLALEAGIGVAMVAGGMLATLLALLAWRRSLPPGKRVRRMIESAAIVLAAIVALVPSLRGQAVPFVPARSSSNTGQWQPFDEALLRRSVAGESSSWWT